ncbi:MULTISPECIES: GntR family transcriptional regulator [Micrococcaceae]|uniref:GntR family transcriptional regulator n=1 Tax=Micrococcaceae TaxID=1268 RepID=UPI0016084D91|nr:MULTISPECIES: GntR family transcriptional regulator [Micrococcaceae]MBB5750708.1 DNA-binding GntR family transcriptional regulator [Micrococcus sp. TA1]HRO28961.1 GntR family transcriptional regulator [Citricoccus sp.]HRO92901.1 GntR family transcriptional regulator [Citricoccus sp.]
MNTPTAPEPSRRDGLVARPLVKVVRRPSTVDLIAVELRAAIYGGTLRPGSSVREAEIAAQLGVSRGPLRESAQRLVQEGLLVTRPGAGLRVATIDRDEVEDLYQARLAIEGHAVRVLSGLDEAQRDERVGTVRDLLAALESAVEAGTDARRIGDADLDLHYGLVEATGNHRLTAYASTLIVQTRIAALSHREGYVVRTDILDVHRSLLRQVADGDAEGACRTLGEHFRQTVDRLRGDLAEPFSTVAGRPDGSGYTFNPLA